MSSSILLTFGELLNIRRKYILVCTLLLLLENARELLWLHCSLFRLRNPALIVLHPNQIRDVYLVVAAVLSFFNLSPSSLEALENVDGSRSFGWITLLLLNNFRQKDLRVEGLLPLRDYVPAKVMLATVVHQMRWIKVWLFEDKKVLCCFIFHISYS